MDLILSELAFRWNISREQKFGENSNMGCFDISRLYRIHEMFMNNYKYFVSYPLFNSNIFQHFDIDAPLANFDV